MKQFCFEGLADYNVNQQRTGVYVHMIAEVQTIN
jgi:hypothetical protein